MSPGLHGNPSLENYGAPEILRILAEVSNYHPHGEVFYDVGGTVNTTLTTVATFYQMATGFTVGNETGAGYVVGASAGSITIGDKGGGVYRINFAGSFMTNKACQIECRVYINTVGYRSLSYVVNHTALNLMTSVAISGFKTLVPNDVVVVKLAASVGTTVAQFGRANLNVQWIAGE